MIFFLFKRPVEESTLNDWASITSDIAKVAAIAIPSVFFTELPLYLKVINAFALFLTSYVTLSLTRALRLSKTKGEPK